MTASVHDSPLIVVDVGASGGASRRWKRVCPEYGAILFEPDQRAHDQLRSAGNERTLVLHTVLSDHQGELEFFLCRAQQLSSVYEPNLELMEKFLDLKYLQGYDVLERSVLPCDTLDNQLLECNVPDIDFIKIDVQGHELAVLRGATQSLRKAVGVEVEVEFLEVYKRQPLFAQVDEFIRTMGFEIFDLEKSYFKRKGTGYYGIRKGQVIFGIALYFVPPENLFKRPDLTERKIIGSTLSYLAYGYFDAAEVLLTMADERRMLSSSTRKQLGQLLGRFRKRLVIPDFRGKQRVHNVLAKLTREFGGEGVNRADLGVGNF